MADCVYDICVVGAGLWGSAAAYHIAGNPEIKMCLIGPGEPSEQVNDILVLVCDSYRNDLINLYTAGLDVSV